MIQHNLEATTQCTMHKVFILLQLLVLSSVFVHCSVSTIDTWHRNTQNQCLVVQHSLSSMSSSPEICPYDSSCRLKEALMQRRYVRHTPVKQVMPTVPALSVQFVEHWLLIMPKLEWWCWHVREICSSSMAFADILVELGINGISSRK